MSEIIEHGDAGNGRAVRVGDSQTQVSVKVYQDIYHQITGRTEQIRKRYSDNLLIDFSELEQLHHKIMQLWDIPPGGKPRRVALPCRSEMSVPCLDWLLYAER